MLQSGLLQTQLQTLLAVATPESSQTWVLHHAMCNYADNCKEEIWKRLIVAIVIIIVIQVVIVLLWLMLIVMETTCNTLLYRRDRSRQAHELKPWFRVLGFRV